MRPRPLLHSHRRHECRNARADILAIAGKQHRQHDLGLEGELGDREEQLVLRAEVVADERGIDARRGGDRADRRPLIPVRGEEAARGVGDRVARAALARPAAAAAACAQNSTCVEFNAR